MRRLVLGAAIAAVSSCASGQGPPSSQPAAAARVQRAAGNSPAKVVFTTGHGEQAPTLGFRLAWMLLAGSYQLALVNPSLQAIDAGADVVVVAGPTDPFDARGRDELDRFLRTGKGGVFLLDAAVMRHPRWLDGGGRAPVATVTIANDSGLDPLLGSYGLRVAPGLILDPPSAAGPYPVAGKAVLDALPAFIGVVMQPHEPPMVTEPTSVVFPYASAVEDLVGRAAGGRRTWSLADSSPESWRQGEYVFQGGYQRAGHPAGPFSIARALELDGAAGRRTRVVVVGDSDFASDPILQLVAVAPGYDGGSRFLRGAIAWAAGRTP